VTETAWTKKTYKDHLLGRLHDTLISHGYARVAPGIAYAKRNSDEVDSRLSVRTVTGAVSPCCVEFELDGFLRLSSVAEVCQLLFGRDGSVATIGGAIATFAPRRHKVSYAFDWRADEDRQWSGLEADLQGFLAFVELVHSAEDLDVDRLRRIPKIGGNFAEGLGESYRYTTPEVAAVLHKLNSRTSRALEALEIAAQSVRLSASQLARLQAYVAS
jgi:hypothetical protein